LYLTAYPAICSSKQFFFIPPSCPLSFVLDTYLNYFTLYRRLYNIKSFKNYYFSKLDTLMNNLSLM
jgi:hypothetical protein